MATDHRFKKGQSGNPRGSSRKMRARQQGVREKLDRALTKGDVDLLVDALVHGVRQGDPASLRLACEYRWGKPEQRVSVAKDLDSMSDDELFALGREAMAVLAEGEALQ